MFDNPHPRLPNQGQWNGYRAPHNTQRMPYNRPSAPFRPRNQGFQNHRPQRPLHSQSHDDNQEHWCETCDRGFPTEQLLNNHNQQHQKCNIDGCQFVAHPKVITKHIQMQHSSGLFKKISKLNNPEEIERWREERRKKYPTKVNIEKKDAELKEKINRGEKMGLRKKEWVKKDDSQGQGQKRNYNNQREQKPQKPNRRNAAKRPKVLPTPVENRSLLPFPGIQALAMDSDDEEDDIEEDVSSHNLIEDDDIVNTDVIAVQEDKTNDEKPVVCGALSSLMCDYGSSDDEEIDNSEQKPILKSGVIEGQQKHNFSKNNLLHVNLVQEQVCKGVSKVMDTISSSGIENKCKPNQLKCVATNSDDIKPENLKNKSVIDLCHNDTTRLKNKQHSDDSGKPVIPSSSINNVENSNGDDDSGPEEIKAEKNLETEIITPDAKNIQNKKKVDFVKRKPIYRKPKPKIPSTLIYKLLSKEMKQERNKVLQCVRYIIKHDFFDKSTK